MKLAILGTDSDVLSLVDAALAAGHQVVWCGDVRDQDRETLASALPRFRESEDWESLLDHRLADAVIVGRGDTHEGFRAEQLKRLAADIMPVLAVHPIGTSVLAYYELDMARHEVHGVLRHYSPAAGSPAVELLHDWVESGNSSIGAVHQIVFQRSLADCSRESVVRHLARDVEVLRSVAGGVRSVSAVGPQAAEASYASLQVQMTGPGVATIRWAVTPAAKDNAAASLSLVGERGTAVLKFSSTENRVTTTVGDSVEEFSTPPFDVPAAAVASLATALPANGTEQSESASTWQAATAAMEVVDTIELSLQKGRTIEVHQQRLTEQLAFRGTMAAFGCGLLMLMFLLLPLAGVVGDLFGVRIKQLWPVMLLAVLALFLLMQALPWLVKRRSPPDTSDNR
jgi:predicted dehydrogenase